MMTKAEQDELKWKLIPRGARKYIEVEYAASKDGNFIYRRTTHLGDMSVKIERSAWPED